MPLPSYRSIKLELISSSLPALNIWRGEGNWLKRATVQAELKERTLPGIPTYSGFTPYFKYEVSCYLIGIDEYLLLEEMVALSHSRFRGGTNGDIKLSDYYLPISQQGWTLNRRQVISGTSFTSAPSGVQAAFCEMPVFLSLGNDHVEYAGNRLWPISFSMEELPSG